MALSLSRSGERDQREKEKERSTRKKHTTRLLPQLTGTQSEAFHHGKTLLKILVLVYLFLLEEMFEKNITYLVVIDVII